MLEHRMTVEAEALVTMVRQRYPGSAGRLDALRGAMTAAGAGLDGILAPLADPAASPEARAAAENALRTELADPAALARSTALPAGHPLRSAAEALSKAFEAVTSGPVEDDALALPAGKTFVDEVFSASGHGFPNLAAEPAHRKRQRLTLDQPVIEPSGARRGDLAGKVDV